MVAHSTSGSVARPFFLLGVASSFIEENFHTKLVLLKFDNPMIEKKYNPVFTFTS